MAFETIIVDISDWVATIILNRPKALNAINAQLMRDVCTALEEADANPKVRCIVLTGSEKAFAAGADITEMADQSFVDMFTQNYFASETTRFNTTRKPIIAAVAGYALGGGCELAMMCDFIIAAETAKFGQPEINLGVIAGIGGTQRLARFVGKSKAEARQAAEKIAEKSQIATIAAKDAVNRSFEMSLAEGLNYERRLFQSLFATEDQKEGMAAFAEKREAQFRDR